jgi:hypothetical protein
MNNQQSNKLKMAQTTLGCVQRENNAALWADIVGIADSVELLEEKIGFILGRSQQQSERTGFSAKKKGLKEKMLDAAFVVCSGLKALASATDNAQLLAQANFSRSSLEKGREESVVNRCRSVFALGEANSGELAVKYHVATGDRLALNNAITAFTGVQTKPRQGRATSAAATAELVTLFTELDEVLTEQLDPLMAKFRFTQPAFFAEYQTARVIVDSAASHDVTVPLPKAA